MNTNQTYTVVTANASGLVSTTFDTFDEARAFGEATDPGSDWGMMPNVPTEAFAGRTDDEYEMGLFYAGVSNRYGVIFADGRRF